ncbi:MAG: nucleotidyl transferase AbiEii/AbiGii toxin family protein [Thermoleophilia bacterium]|nr:nucleotidyl transferase AbiEii/AbiGii toxin family protein [Thermoleophilia bacterium]
MARESGYASPKAFRRALTDKLKGLAAKGKWELPQLQRQITYDRLLERLYVIDKGWVVKGATALLARDLGVRGTIDIDIFRQVAIEIAERELREAAALDLGDWFEFEVGPSQPANDAAKGLRARIKASIGATVWTSFHVDLVGAEVTMTGTPDDVPALARVAMPDVSQRGYRVYPLVDHVADKVAATFDRYGAAAAVSTRYKDLVDLVAITSGGSVEAEAQMKALDSEAQRRGVTLGERFEVPDPDLWVPGYAAEAKRSLLDIAQSLDEALAIVRPFLDPALDGTARGTWNPAALRWE